MTTNQLTIDDLLSETPTSAAKAGHGNEPGVTRPLTNSGFKKADSFASESAVAHCKTAEEFCKAAGLDWNVVSRAVAVGGNAEGADRFHATVRGDTNTILSITTNGFEVLQPHEALAPLATLVSAGATFRGGGSFRGGKTIWGQVHLGDYEVIKGDIVHMFAHVRDSYDGVFAWTLQTGSVRIVCQNTLMHASSAGTMLARSTHKKGIVETVENASQALEALRGAARKRVDDYRKLAAMKVSKGTVTELLKASLPRPQFRDAEAAKQAWDLQCRDVLELMESRGKGIEIDGVLGTAWGALNAVTEWADHRLAHSGRANEELVLKRTLEGSAQGVKAKAFDFLIKKTRD